METLFLVVSLGPEQLGHLCLVPPWFLLAPQALDCPPGVGFLGLQGGGGRHQQPGAPG